MPIWIFLSIFLLICLFGFYKILIYTSSFYILEINPLLNISTTLWFAVHSLNGVLVIHGNVNFDVIQIYISSLTVSTSFILLKYSFILDFCTSDNDLLIFPAKHICHFGVPLTFFSPVHFNQSLYQFDATLQLILTHLSF